MASLGSDLAAVRKNRGLTLDDVQDITKLSSSVLTSIEDDSIFEEMGDNTTYKRSYVRNYAKALKIEESAIIEALNRVEAGEYKGNIGERTETASEENQEPGDEAKNEEQPGETEKVDDHSPEYSLEKPALKTNMAHKTDRAQTSSFDWVNLNNRTIESQKSSLSKWWIIMVGAIIIIAAAIFSFFYISEGPANSTPNTSEPEIQEPTSPADTLQEALLPNNDRNESVFSHPPLPDTLSITVVAANGKLNPVYVFTDLKTKRPFWLEKNERMKFSFIDSFQVQAVNQYEKMKLIFNGHIIENAYDRFYNPESKMVELGRSVIKKHPEWLISANATVNS